jgi:enamine deaminase RidA (YjgF/YER057c/UK114 family)
MSPSTHSPYAEQRLQDLGIVLPALQKPMGTYTETVLTGNLLFLSGTVPIEAGVPRFQGRIGDDLNIEDGQHAARLAALNAVALAKAHLGSLNRVKQIVRLGVMLLTTPEFQDHPKVAEGASELLVAVFGSDKLPTRRVYGVSSLPLALSVELELIFEVTA